MPGRFRQKITNDRPDYLDRRALSPFLLDEETFAKYCTFKGRQN